MKVETLYNGAMRKGQTSRYGRLVMVVMGGEGAVLIQSQEFFTTQKWAMSKGSTGNGMRDRMMFFERIEALVSRPGSFCSTKGNVKQLIDIVKAMRENGLDPNEWLLSPELKEQPKFGQDEPKKKVAKETEPEADPPKTPPAPEPLPEPQGTWIREKKAP